LSNATLDDSGTNYFIVRHSKYKATNSTSYALQLPSTAGNISIPHIGSGSLTLHGRDSKIHVTDYKVAGINVLYFTAEISAGRGSLNEPSFWCMVVPTSSTKSP
jgi:beta-galactosidase